VNNKEEPIIEQHPRIPLGIRLMLTRKMKEKPNWCLYESFFAPTPGTWCDESQTNESSFTCTVI